MRIYCSVYDAEDEDYIKNKLDDEVENSTYILTSRSQSSWRCRCMRILAEVSNEELRNAMNKVNPTILAE